MHYFCMRLSVCCISHDLELLVQALAQLRGFRLRLRGYAVRLLCGLARLLGGVARLLGHRTSLFCKDPVLLRSAPRPLGIFTLGLGLLAPLFGIRPFGFGLPAKLFIRIG
jgi:hypothetical protein